jgi:hypothetical protein
VYACERTPGLNWRTLPTGGAIVTKKDEYVAKTKLRLDEWSADLDVLEAKVQKAKEDAKEKYRAQLVTLRARRQEGEKKLDAIRSAAEDSWEQLKAETENVLAALKDSVHQFKLHFN